MDKPPPSPKDNPMNDDLKACPFCNCAMRLHYDPELKYYGPEGDHDGKCLLANLSFVDYADKAQALREWNTRAPLAALTPALQTGAVGEREISNDDWYAEINQGRRGPPHPTDEQITAMRLRPSPTPAGPPTTSPTTKVAEGDA